MKVDAHQHFWALERGDYGWLTPALTPIYRDFTPEDLIPILRGQGIDGTVVVQAAPTTAETDYMLSLAAQHSFIMGVVGWVDFEAPDAPAQIAERASHPKLVGLRPMIQDIADDAWMLQDNLRPAFQAMVEHDLVFDALTLPQHLGHLGVLLSRYPKLKTVIDHGSKPSIATDDIAVWAQDMAHLAQTTSAHVKLSGLVTEAGPNWNIDQLRPYVAYLLDVFGPKRMIWGSDWPVCTLASDYNRWCATTQALLADLGAADQAAILGDNAIELYGLAQVKSSD